MEIWFINHYAVPPSYYPLARQKYFAKYLSKKGHNVTIFCASTVHHSNLNLINSKNKFIVINEKYAKYVAIKCKNYEKNGLKRISNMLEFARKLPRVAKRFNKPDVIISVSLTMQACNAGLKLAKKYKCQGIAEIADLWPESLIDYHFIKEKSLVAKYLRHYEKNIYKKADKIIFTMEGAYDYIKERNWQNIIPIEKVFLINNGVDLEDFNNQKNQILDYKCFLTEKKKIIYAGALGSANNFLKVVGELRKIDEVDFLVFGKGDQYPLIEERIASENIKNVILMGNIPKSEIPFVLSKAYSTLFIVDDNKITRFGISPNKLFDYFAAGKPILMNINCPYNPAEKYKACICASQQKSISDIVHEVLSLDKNQYLNYCKNSLKAASDYSFEILTNKLLDVINK